MQVHGRSTVFCTVPFLPGDRGRGSMTRVKLAGATRSLFSGIVAGSYIQPLPHNVKRVRRSRLAYLPTAHMHPLYLL